MLKIYIKCTIAVYVKKYLGLAVERVRIIITEKAIAKSYAYVHCRRWHVRKRLYSLLREYFLDVVHHKSFRCNKSFPDMYR